MPVNGTNTSGYNILPTKALGLVRFKSVMQVFNSTEKDHGHYKCVASNELGSDSLVISLEATSQSLCLTLP